MRHSFVRVWLAVTALFCGLVSSAFAVDVNLGNLAGTSVAEAYSYSPGTVIQDVFHFDLAAPSSFNSIVSQISLPSFFDIENFGVSLALPAGPTFYFSPVGSVISSGVLDLPQGNDVELTVTGTVDGNLGGNYSVLMAAVGSVPEPAQWILMLAGLALLPSVRALMCRGKPGRDRNALLRV